VLKKAYVSNLVGLLFIFDWLFPQVQRVHPHELHTLLSRIVRLLRSSAWDTRIAAGQAVAAVLEHVPQWDPAGAAGGGESSRSRSSVRSRVKALQFFSGFILDPDVLGHLNKCFGKT
jgi:hypothetical protein